MVYKGLFTTSKSIKSKILFEFREEKKKCFLITALVLSSFWDFLNTCSFVCIVSGR